MHDSELRELQVSSTARLGAFFAHHLHTDTRLRTLGDASRSAVDSVSDGIRTPAAIAFLGFLVMVVVGSRSLITHGIPAIGTFAHWPGVGDLFDSFGSAWRYTGPRFGVAGTGGAGRHRRRSARCSSAPPGSRRR